ncbi:MAG: hypothetical protein IJR03_01425 [Bacteroidales bacterium]|nr:hypothetical protein [Bacteroidales bacterium]
MRKKIIFFICLAVCLHSIAFAQISSSYHSMVKVANEKVHPRTSKIAMVNDSVSVSYMDGIDTVNVGYHKFFLIKEGVSNIHEVKISGIFDQITDIKVLNDTLYFCGSFITNKSYSYGFVARAGIYDFFYGGNYAIFPIQQTTLIDRIEPYIDHNETYVACLPHSRDYLYKLCCNSNDYEYALLNIDGNCNEGYADIMIYKNYIALLSVFQQINNPNFFGYVLRLYDRGSLQTQVTNNKILIPTDTYPNYPLLAKSEINNDIYITTAKYIQENDSTCSLLDINRINNAPSVTTTCINYKAIFSPPYFNILWGVKSTEIQKQRELYLLTTKADKESRVLYFDFLDNTHPLKIFEYNNFDDFYTSMEIYNNEYFICLGGEYNVGYHNFATWDKNATYNEYECESLIKKNYTAQNISLNIRSDSLHREPGELNFLERSGIVKEIEYRIKCKIQK